MSWAYKITFVLERDYGVHVSIDRVYRLMSSMDIPKMSSVRPFIKGSSSSDRYFLNHLNQEFIQVAVNPVWISDLTYIRASSK